jgi:hypothetical protein
MRSDNEVFIKNGFEVDKRWKKQTFENFERGRI